jgi:hypothetical protein
MNDILQDITGKLTEAFNESTKEASIVSSQLGAIEILSRKIQDQITAVIAHTNAAKTNIDKIKLLSTGLISIGNYIKSEEKRHITLLGFKEGQAFTSLSIKNNIKAHIDKIERQNKREIQLASDLAEGINVEKRKTGSHPVKIKEVRRAKERLKNVDNIVKNS